MGEFAQRITSQYPLRYKRQEKENMRTYLIGQSRSLGYDAKLQSVSGGTNVVVGDPESAKLVFIAHYDTGLRELLPQFLCPTRPLTYLLYQALTPVVVMLGSFLISFAVSFPLNMPRLMLPLFLILIVGALFYLRYGPGEKRTNNDNSSGVAALLEVMEGLTPRYRNSVAFAFLDAGSTQRGARGLRKAYPSLREKTVINLDCVGCGDEILILPSKYSRWNGDLLDAINESFENTEKKTCFDKVDGLVYFPSDNRTFRYSVSICACEQAPGFGRFVRQHTARAIDAENLRILREGLVKVIMRLAG